MGAAALRLAALSGATGLERAVAAAVLAMALVVAETLGLGLFGLGSSSVALGLAAAVTWLVTHRLAGSPANGIADELGRAWRGAGSGARAAAGAVGLVTIGWIGWQLRHPFLGLDSYLYHLALAGSWAHDGHPGSIVPIVEGLPVANYPVTSEVSVTWALAISHSWVWASVVTPLYGVLIGAGAWLGLRHTRVPGGIAALAIAAFVAQPIVATQFGGPLTDVAAVAWLVGTVGLCAAARDNPRLLPIALIGAALSFGTKTTGTVVLLAALLWAVWPHRRALSPIARPLLFAALAGVVVGGVWTLRNLIDHGSPLWPFQSTSFGDPVPATLRPFKASFLSHPHAMLSGRTHDYYSTLAGAAILLIAPLVAVLVARTRTVLALGAMSALALLVWAAAPYTGIAQSTALATGATRYMLPALLCCTVAAAVAARRPGFARVAMGTLLTVSILLSVRRTWQLGYPYVPSRATVAGLAVVGAAGALVLGSRLAGSLARLFPRAMLRPVLGAAIAVALSASAGGYVQRHSDAGLGDGKILKVLAGVPAYAQTHVEVAMAPTTIALLRGDHLQHNVVLLSSTTPCPAVRERATTKVLILQRAPITTAYRRLAACLHGVQPIYQDAALQLYARAG